MASVAVGEQPSAGHLICVVNMGATIRGDGGQRGCVPSDIPIFSITPMSVAWRESTSEAICDPQPIDRREALGCQKCMQIWLFLIGNAADAFNVVLRHFMSVVNVVLHIGNAGVSNRLAFELNQ